MLNLYHITYGKPTAAANNYDEHYILATNIQDAIRIGLKFREQKYKATLPVASITTLGDVISEDDLQKDERAM